MEVVLGVSMTPTAVRMVLVEGSGGDGVTLDATVLDATGSGAAEQVVAAILGTREDAAEGAHRLASVGVAWTDHADGARLREALRVADINDVVMVSELHAASALAQAVGRRTGCARTALLLVEPEDVTLAVVRTADGAVVAVQSRALLADAGTDDPADVLRAMVAGLEHTAEPPEAVFLMGAGRDVADLAARIADGTILPVHGPDDAEHALARGAALAAAGAPRFEAATVAVAAGPADDATAAGPAADETAAGPTQLAAAGYMAPLGYSAVPDDDADDLGEIAEISEPDPVDAEPAEKPFLLVGSTLATLFVVGVAALVITLAVRISPAVEQRTDPGEVLTPPAPTLAQDPAGRPSSPAVETIQAPRPVVQEGPQQVPRTVFVPAPAAVAPEPAPQVVPPAPAAPPAAPVAPPPAPVVTAPAPVVTVPAPPAPALPPIVVAPVIPFLPPLLQSPIRIPAAPVTQSPPTQSPVTQSPVTQSPVTQSPVSQSPVSQTPPTQTQATSAPSTPTWAPAPSSTATAPTADPSSPSAGQSPGRRGSGSDSGSGSRGTQAPIWPLWPGFGN